MNKVKSVQIVIYLLTFFAIGWRIRKKVVMGVWNNISSIPEVFELVGCLLLFIAIIISITNRKTGAIVGLVACILLSIYYIPIFYNTIKLIYNSIKLVRDQQNSGVAIDFSITALIILIGIPLLLVFATCLSVYWSIL